MRRLWTWPCGCPYGGSIESIWQARDRFPGVVRETCWACGRKIKAIHEEGVGGFRHTIWTPAIWTAWGYYLAPAPCSCGDCPTENAWFRKNPHKHLDIPMDFGAPHGFKRP